MSQDSTASTHPHEGQSRQWGQVGIPRAQASKATNANQAPKTPTTKPKLANKKTYKKPKQTTNNTSKTIPIMFSAASDTARANTTPSTSETAICQSGINFGGKTESNWQISAHFLHPATMFLTKPPTFVRHQQKLCPTNNRETFEFEQKVFEQRQSINGYQHHTSSTG
jgi:hypothetical protein